MTKKSDKLYQPSAKSMIGIVNLGKGNTHKLAQYLRRFGKTIQILESTNECTNDNLDVILLPGVGNFESVMRELQRYSWKEKLSTFVNNGGMLIGICVGAQVLLQKSEESEIEGLGYIEGVCRLNHLNLTDLNVGRKKIIFKKNIFDNKLITRLYFCHRYSAIFKSDSLVVATTEQGINAIYKSNRIYGIQFHPEKSGTEGMKILDAIFKGEI